VTVERAPEAVLAAAGEVDDAVLAAKPAAVDEGRGERVGERAGEMGGALGGVEAFEREPLAAGPDGVEVDADAAAEVVVARARGDLGGVGMRLGDAAGDAVEQRQERL
jgi:hypothetical protein